MEGSILVRSEAKTVNEYIDELEGERKTVILHLRDIAKEVMSTFKESMDFGMPTYKNGDKVFAYASQKNYISIYVNNSEVTKKYRNGLGKANFGKNCIRYRKFEDINWGTLKKVLKKAYS